MPTSNEDISRTLQEIQAQQKEHEARLIDLQDKAEVWHKREAPGKKTNAEQVIDALKVVQAIALIGTILKRLSAVVILIAATWAALKGVLPK